MLLRIAILLLLFISVGNVCADPVDDLVKSEMEQQGIPGLSLAVVQNGRIVKEAGYGFANVEHQAAALPTTVFQSGSVGNQPKAESRDGGLRCGVRLAGFCINDCR